MLQILFLSSLISCNRDSIDGGYNIQKLHSTIVSTTTEVNFGNVVVLYDDTKSFQIINAGKADLEITSMALNVNEDESYVITTMPIVVEDEDGAGNTDDEEDTEQFNLIFSAISFVTSFCTTVIAEGEMPLSLASRSISAGF